ncbi:hypothetical protein QN386_02515 [Pseudomonas sp. CCI3.2]|uniref:hypothetical protein n=1 Tax=unclassified Pseudomonas TaxID=196821 RepID=UPI002AC8D4EC|nr:MULTISPECIES: hypothetical protein [unclassified Pseudomonas]MEB0080051.1 hypothetical protein [Pseudomonas sp. MH10out]MEB0091903.1 hypothetical protein [Pseudomonas sp. CCI4.2]MEB0100201.1 hypothetical protein [Pseudomonas sp. CCI3.2]MEB0121061.1 hypothetical protein [Pseudomonas sp. CCI1.2]MEB0130099.1 hypothetical protein [Pseudomonas sp. CCI2.4]
MTSQRIAQLRISPLHIQQALFASLALLITLVVGQHVQRWDNHQDAVQVRPQFSTAQSYSTVSAPASREAVLSLRATQATAPQIDRTQTQSWVF